MVELTQRHIAVDADLVLRDEAAHQGLPLGIGYALHLAAFVVGQALARVGVGGLGAGHLHNSRQADVSGGSAHADFVAAALNFPAVGLGVPVAERLVVQRQGHGLALPCSQLHLGKGLQLLRGAEHLRVRLGNVQLHNLGTGTVAGVLYGQGHAVGICLQVRVGKVRVAQAVAEGERHRHARGLVVAVAHVQPLTVLHGAALARKVVLGGGVLIGVGPGFRQLAAGVDLAGQHIDHSACTGLTAQCAVNQRLAVGQPRRFQRCTRAEHDHGVGVCLLYSLQKLNLVVRQLHIGAVQTLALLDLVQP